MQETTKRNLWRWGGYGLFFLAVFVYFLYRTFPYKQVFDRYTLPFQRQAKVRIKMKTIHPYWLTGVASTDLIVRKVVPKGIAAVKIDSITLHASLFRLIFGKISATLDAQLANGSLSASVIQDGSKFNVKVDINKISLNALGEKRPKPAVVVSSKKSKQKAAPPKDTSLLATLFAPVYGRLQSNIQLKLPLTGGAAPAPARGRNNNNNRSRRQPRRNTPRNIDIPKITGKVRITIRNFSVGPGEFPTAQMGDLPVPRLRLGIFVLQIRIDKGKAEIVRCESRGTDGEIKLTGSIDLQSDMRYAVFRGQLDFKINRAFIDSLDPSSILKTGLGLLGPAPSGGFYRYRLRLPFNGGRPDFQRM